jgi:2,4-dienoyl-CoA reductase (NADPH2)
VTIARALIANSDLVHRFAQGDDSPELPCSYCEKCRLNLVENPLGCYDVTRYDGNYGEMIRQMMSVYLHPGK